MKQTFTKRKATIRHLGAKLYVMLAMVLLAWTPTKAQYCAATHYYGCGWGTQKTYAVIEEVQFEANGKLLWKKSADGCNYTGSAIPGDHDHDITTTPTFKLNYGGDFTLKINGSNPAYVGYTSMAVGVWLDANRDQDYADAGEFLGSFMANARGGASGPLPALSSVTFNVPCGAKGSGNTMIRIRSAYQGYSPWTKNFSCGGNPFTTYNYGETENYAVEMVNPSTLSAGFFAPDTSFVDQSVLFRNANQSGYKAHDWDIGADGSYEYMNTVDATHKFKTTGVKCIQLRSENCLGKDSITKCINVVDPPGPPIPDFVADKNVVELYNSFQLIDLSNNGPSYWDWYMYQADDSAATHIDGDDNFDLRGGNENVNQNPEVFSAKGIPGFPTVGLWSVCLTSSNQKWGALPKPVCKKDYIEVTKGCDVEMGPGTLTSIPGNVITCAAGTMKNKDDGSGNYATPEANLDALVAPCGASELTFTFDKWKVKSNVNLKIYDGQDASGIALHPTGGYTESNPPTGDIVSNSGAMYFLWNSNGTSTDEGFIGHWTSVVGPKFKPVANFDVVDTGYNSKWMEFTNTTSNITGEVFYTWEVEDKVQGTKSIEGLSKDFQALFSSNQAYTVCLTVETCVGRDQKCKKIEVVAPDTKSQLDFMADNRRPKAGETVTFNATSDKANMYQWTFFPGNTVNITPTMADNSEIEVEFSAPGKYTVSLRGYNTADSARSVATLIKDQYIVVINYCTPLIGIRNSADFAINSVLLEDDANPRAELINHQSGEAAYTDETENIEAPTLTFGGTYHVSVGRNTTVNSMSRKIWIDWNIDGDFDDLGEEVGYEPAANTALYTKTFTVPDLANAFEGVTRMRIGTSYKNDPNEPCGASSGVKNANRIGEFEDYAVRLQNDYTNPIITMNGADTVYVELNTTYTDASASAMDPTEGDITSRMKTTSDVDINAAGIYYVTYSVNDASGNPATPVTRVVYVVVDQTAPKLTLLGKNPEVIEFDPNNSSYKDPGATATDNNDGDITSAIQVSGVVDVFKIGTYQLTYTVQDAQGNKSSSIRTVIVQDTKAPVITNNEIKVIGGVKVVEVQLQSVFVDRTVGDDEYNNGTFGPKAVLIATPGDNGDATVDTREKGTTTALYSMTDESGNTTTLEIDYVVEDYIAPTINLNTLDTVLHPVNTPYTPVTPSVKDNLYKESEVSLTHKTNVNPYILGKYEDTYTATDASGNVEIKKRWVRVFDGKKPVISGKDGNILKLGLYSQVWLFDFLKMTDDYDAPVELFSRAKVLSNTMNVYKEGTYSAIFQTIDASGNESEPFTLFILVSREYEQLNGVDENESTQLMNVYPNPSSSIFNISVTLPSEEAINVCVYDILGNKVEDVYEGKLSNGIHRVDMSGKARGVYFIRMTTEGGIFNQKVVLN